MVIRFGDPLTDPSTKALLHAFSESSMKDRDLLPAAETTLKSDKCKQQSHLEKGLRSEYGGWRKVEVLCIWWQYHVFGARRRVGASCA